MEIIEMTMNTGSIKIVGTITPYYVYGSTSRANTSYRISWGSLREGDAYAVAFEAKVPLDIIIVMEIIGKVFNKILERVPNERIAEAAIQHFKRAEYTAIHNGATHDE